MAAKTKTKAPTGPQRIELRIKGEIVPAVRMTQRGKWVKPEAQAYIKCKSDTARQARLQLPPGFVMFAQRPLRVTIHMSLTRNLHKRDFDNLQKSLTDPLQGIVYQNDSWIDESYFSKTLGAEEDEAVIVIEVIDE